MSARQMHVWSTLNKDTILPITYYTHLFPKLYTYLKTILTRIKSYKQRQVRQEPGAVIVYT